MSGGENEEQCVREAVLRALAFWQTKANDDDDHDDKERTTCDAVHEECAFCMETTTDDEPQNEGTTTATSMFVQGSRHIVPLLSSSLSSAENDDGAAAIQNSILSVHILPVGRQTAASVHVRVGVKWTGFIVFLRHENSWKAISVALAPVSSTTAAVVTPDDFAAVAALTWHGYRAASRSCDGAAMQQAFHSWCRLTYTDQNDCIQIIPAETFYDMVQYRYEKVSPHLPFAHLKHAVEMTGRQDSLLSIVFATPTLAMVTLRIGHPPFLWTDLLTCAKIRADDNDGRWWIVHKSSENEPFLLDQAQST